MKIPPESLENIVNPEESLDHGSTKLQKTLEIRGFQ